MEQRGRRAERAFDARESHSTDAAGRRVVSVAVAGIAAAGWAGLAVLGVAVRVALFRQHRSQGAVSILWGLGFALFLWAGLRSVGVAQARAIPFALVAGAAIAVFVYLRGAALDNPPAGRPGVYQRRLLSRLRTGRGPRARYQPYTGKTRELLEARTELERGDYAAALDATQVARRVAVAQRKRDELLEVRELARLLRERSPGRTREASERLARKVEADLRSFG
jgi:hypothetical protein